MLRTTASRKRMRVFPKLLHSQGLEVPEAHHLLLLLVPQLQGHRFQALPESHDGDVMKNRILVESLLQVVVGDLGAEMVDVVKADIAREPLEYLRQLVVGTALQRGERILPVGMVLPIGVLKLVLDVEHPHAGRGREQQQGQLDQQDGLEADGPACDHEQGEQRHVRQVNAVALALPAHGRGEPLKERKQEERPEDEHDDRVPVEPVAEFPPPGQHQILVHRQRQHIAHPTPFQVARRGVMDGVMMPPLKVRRKREDAAEGPHPVVGFHGFEIGPMSAVVQDDEDAHQHTDGRDGERQRQPVRNFQAAIHQIPANEVGDEGIRHIPQAAPEVRILILRHDVLPARRGMFRRGGARVYFHFGVVSFEVGGIVP